MVIISNKPGQLGNRLFIYCHFIAYAIEHNETILNPAFDEYAEFFKGTYDQRITKFPKVSEKGHLVNKSKWIFQLCYYFARILHRLHIRNRLVSHIYLDWGERIDLEALGPLKTRYLFVQGWVFRASNWLKAHKNKLLPLFDLVEPYHSNVESFITQLRSRYDTIVGIHIRRGDYKTFENGRYFYSLPQYRHQIAQLHEQLKDQNPVFVICSNEQVDLGQFKGLPCVGGPGHFIEDLYVLAQCDYITGPPSTFTMWASFYGTVPLRSIKDPEGRLDIHAFKPYADNK